MNFSTGYINDINSRAVLINNTAVQLLQQNKPKDAIGWLRRGLSNLALIEKVNYDAQQQNIHAHHASLKCIDTMDVEGEKKPAYSVEIPKVRDTVISVVKEDFLQIRCGMVNSFQQKRMVISP
jgi:hypothetical protein